MKKRFNSSFAVPSGFAFSTPVSRRAPTTETREPASKTALSKTIADASKRPTAAGRKAA